MVATAPFILRDANQLCASRSLQRGGAIHEPRATPLESRHRSNPFSLLLDLFVHADTCGLDRRSIWGAKSLLAWLCFLVDGFDHDWVVTWTDFTHRFARSPGRGSGDYF